MLYKLPKLKNTKNCILAFDPGSVNMGISLVQMYKGKPRVLANATMTSPIHDILLFQKQKDAFLKEVRAWKRYSPKAIIAERFQSRGLRGSTVECVSMMLGILGMLNLPVKFITASTWKNKYQRRYGCHLKRDIYKNIKTTPHQLDASLIGCYGLEIAYSKDIDFSLQDIIKMVEKTALNGKKK